MAVYDVAAVAVLTVARIQKHAPALTRDLLLTPTLAGG